MTSERKSPLSKLRYAGDSTVPQREIPLKPVAPSPLASVFGDDDDFHSNLSDSGEIITLGGDDLGLYDGLPVSELQEPEQKPAAKRAKPKVRGAVEISTNDKKIFDGIQDLGPLTGKHIAKVLNREYETKKRRITQLERDGYLDSELHSGLKLYNNTKYAVDKTERYDEEPPKPLKRYQMRHSLMLATQVILLRNSRQPGKHQLLPDGYTLGALPVVHEKLLQESADKVQDKKYGDAIYMRDWRKKCQSILDSPKYPVVESYDEDSMWAAASEHAEYLDQYFRKAGGGTAAAALTHWDDNYEFANTRRSRVGKDGTVNNRHKRRPDAVIARPHLRVDGVTYGMSIAVELEISRKDKPEWRNIIHQGLDQPLWGGQLYVADRPDIVNALNAVWKEVYEEEMEKAQRTGIPSKVEYYSFQVIPPAYFHKDYDAQGFFG